jgi:hypothetical protein
MLSKLDTKKSSELTKLIDLFLLKRNKSNRKLARDVADWVDQVYIFIYLYINVCMYIYMYICIYVYIYIYLCMSIYVYPTGLIRYFKRFHVDYHYICHMSLMPI